MTKFTKKHVFSAELPYEDDAVTTLFLRNHFERVDSYVMSLGQMSRIPPSKLLTYKNGGLISERVYVQNNMRSRGLKLYFYTIPLALMHVVVDFLRALKTINFKCDIFFAQHFLPAFLAVVLRKLRILKCERIIFWQFDLFLIPPQFPRNIYYRGIDMIHRYVRNHLDEIWFTTPRLKECDYERYGPLPKSVKVKFTECAFFKRIETKEQPAKLPPMKIAFLGSLRPNNCVYESIDTIAECISLGMKVELHIIGSGPEEERMKKYTTKKKLDKYIKFYGFENRGVEIAKIFAQCHVGIALYNSDPYGPNWFLTSGKFRRFIAQGLPVITTTPPYYNKYLTDFGAGVIVDNSPHLVALEIKKIYDSPKKLARMRRGANRLYKAYDTEKIFADVFEIKEANKAEFSPTITSKIITLRPLEKKDIESLRKLRNKNRKHFFSSNIISAQQQLSWFNTYEERPDDNVFIIEDSAHNFVGSISLYNIDMQIGEAEFGRFMIDKSHRSSGYGLAATKLIVKYAFDEMELNTIYLEVKKGNRRAIKIYEKAGFKILDVEANHPNAIFMEIKRKNL